MLAAVIRLQRRLVEDVAQDLHPFDHRALVVLLGQIVVLNRWRFSRIGRLDAHPAARLRLQLADRSGEPRERMQLFAHPIQAERQEVRLHVGTRGRKRRPVEAARVARGERQRAATKQHVTQAQARFAPKRPHVVIQRDRLRALDHHARLEVVFEVLANVRRIEQYRNAVPLEQRCRPDPRKLEQLRRIDRPARQKHFSFRARSEPLAGAQVFDADRTHSLEQDPRSQRARDDREVRPAFGKPQVAGRSR